MDDQGGLIRATQLSGFEKLVRRYDCDPERLLNLAGLSNIYLHEPELYMPFGSYVLLMELSARETGQNLFGAELGNDQGLRVLGAEAYGVSSSFTLREALDFLSGNLDRQTTGSAIRLDRYEDTAMLVNEITASTPYGARQTTDHTIAIGIRMMKTFYGSSWAPRDVFFQHSLSREDRRDYRKLFGDRIHFDSDVSGFSFDAALLDCPLPEADPVAHKMFLQRQRLAALEVPESFIRRVESTIRVTMPNGDMGLNSTARMLAMSSRSLQRRLALEGTSYAKLVDATRCQVAEQYLRNCDLQLGQISELLGFTQLSNLSHAFQRWHGMSPSEWKKRHLNGVSSV